MRECLGKHLRMSSTFPIAILNGTCFFREAKWSFRQRLTYRKEIKLNLQIVLVFEVI